MGFYFRRSVAFGPIRLNFSTSGIGISAGVKGARVSTSPKGSYVTLGSNGFYYRRRLDARPPRGRGPMPATGSDEAAHRIVSASARQIVDSDSKETLEQLNTTIRQRPTYPIFIVLLVLTLMMQAPTWLLVVGGVVTYLVYRGDRSKRTAPLFYEMDDASARQYEVLIDALSHVAETKRIWRIVSSRPERDWKRSGGAATADERVSVSLSRLAPPFIATNIKVWGFKMNDQQILFFPDRVLIFQDGSYGAVSYQQLQVQTGQTTFIETEALPGDTTVVRYSWQFINKNGGPDRRFRDNREVPVALYGVLGLRSRTGLNIQLHFSNPSKVDVLQSALSSYSGWIRTKEQRTDDRDRYLPPGGGRGAGDRRAAHQAPPGDPLSVLGLDRTATFEDVSRAYRLLAKTYHPDKVAHLAPEFKDVAESRMKVINRAYEELEARFEQ
jgi:hypothetical protein